MSVQKLEKVLNRIRNNPKIPKNQPWILKKHLQQAIIKECGTHPTTYYHNKDALKTLEWIVWTRKGKWFKLTDKDLTDY